MIKELPCPSKISLLDISYKEVEQVVYFVNYIILDEGKQDPKNNVSVAEWHPVSSPVNNKPTIIPLLFCIIILSSNVHIPQ